MPSSSELNIQEGCSLDSLWLSLNHHGDLSNSALSPLTSQQHLTVSTPPSSPYNSGPPPPYKRWDDKCVQASASLQTEGQCPDHHPDQMSLHSGNHLLSEYMTSPSHLPGGLKMMISSKSLDISCSRPAKVIFPFCSRGAEELNHLMSEGSAFGTASWQ